MPADLRADLRHALDPVAFATDVLGIVCDEWQARVLRSSSRRQILLCSRQSGKSTIASVAALHRALFFPGSLVLVVSPSLRQSSELFRKVVDHLARMKVAPVVEEENRLSTRFANGSRVVSLPASPDTIRGFSGASLIVEDEAAFVDDDTYHAIRPMLAVTQGRLVLMSTPFGRRGHFFEAFERGGAEWERFRVTAGECPRIASAFLSEERRSLGEWRFRQEYGAEFVETDDQLFAMDAVDAAITSDVASLGAGEHGGRFVVGVDLGQARDSTAIVVVERVEGRPVSLRARYVERAKLGTGYPLIVERVSALVRSRELAGRCSLVVDATGVGRPVVDLFVQAGLHPIAVTITGGASANVDGDDHRIPKRDLCASLQVLLQSGQLKIARAMALRTALVDELLAFRVRIGGSAHETYGASGTSHDDLVIALALACYGARELEAPTAPTTSTRFEFIPDDDPNDHSWVLGGSRQQQDPRRGSTLIPGVASVSGPSIRRPPYLQHRFGR